MDTVEESVGGVLGIGNDINRIAGTVNDRRGQDAARNDVSAWQAGRRCFTREEHRLLPEDSSRGTGDAVRIERVHAIVLCSEIHDVLGPDAWDVDLVEIKNLAINRTVDGELTTFSKGGRLHISGCENRFIGIQAASRIVVVPGN